MLNFDSTIRHEFETEKEDRLLKTPEFSYGIKFLDEALDGFYNGEVVLIGSKTGRGKSHLCNIIAEHNARAGHKVLFLALEAENKEVGRRIKFRMLCKRFFEESGNHYPLSYNRWRKGHLESYLEKYEDAVLKDVSDWGDNLIIRYREGDFTKDDVRTNFISYADDVDIIILDHIHYIDIYEQNENAGLKAIVKTIRDLNLQFKKPIILVTHLRKTDKKFDGLVPSEEDVYGSSDIAKIATTIIMMSPAYEYAQGSNCLMKTYFHTPKCRGETSALPYVAQLLFNTKINEYQDVYMLGKHTLMGKKFEYPDYYPHWFSYRDEQEMLKGGF